MMKLPPVTCTPPGLLPRLRVTLRPSVRCPLTIKWRWLLLCWDTTRTLAGPGAGLELTRVICLSAGIVIALPSASVGASKLFSIYIVVGCCVDGCA
ncbi:MAG: hypothetical protein FWE42_01410 [Defluviitaleaceae bacterium]|nr:hypothetical protein [Defluviitaleaceae bacterium]